MSLLVKALSCHEADEVEGALDYARLALQMYESGDKQRGRMFAEMAGQEYNHAQEIHELLVKEIEAAREKADRLGIRPPEAMTRKYEEEHGRYVSAAALAKSYLDVCERLASA